MAGNIHRQKKNRDFVTIDTHCLRNKSLKWDAKGLHSYLMQLPDDWKINVADLEKRSLDRHDGTMSPMRALIAAGYVYRERISGEKGRFVGYDYHLFERPEQTIEWLTVNGKTVNGKTVNGKSITSKVLKPLSEVSKNEVEGEENTPTPEPKNLKEEKKESPKVAAKGSLKSCPKSCSPSDYCAGGKCDLNGCFIPTVGNYEQSEFDIYGAQPLEIVEGETFAEMEDRLRKQTNGTFEVTAIASPTSLPGVTIVEAVKTRAENTLEAEQMITGWITGEGEQTVKHRYNTAKQRFDPANAAAIAAHYCSVYTKNAANKGRLLADPITHFSDGLFSYLKNEESWGRNNQPGNQSQVRNQEPPANFKSQIRH